MSGNIYPNNSLSNDLQSKQARHDALTQQISLLLVDIHRLTVKFSSESNKLQIKISKVQFSRPRGNPANYWPHRPMTNRIRLFYQAKENKEKLLRQNQELVKLTFKHNRAILVHHKLVLLNEQSDLESQIKLIKIRLNLPI